MKNFVTGNDDATHPFFWVRMLHRMIGHPAHPVREHPTHVPKVPTAAERLLRVKLVLSEALEFAAASGYDVTATCNIRGEDGISGCCDLEHAEPQYECLPPDIVEAADALADLNVVVNGSHLVWGTPARALDEEVHSSNMSKFGADGKPLLRPDGKLMKGPNFRKPDIRRVLLDYGWTEGT